jgi:hypothetical protein
LHAIGTGVESDGNSIGRSVVANARVSAGALLLISREILAGKASDAFLFLYLNIFTARLLQ